jgi:hypothetical protein
MNDVGPVDNRGLFGQVHLLPGIPVVPEPFGCERSCVCSLVGADCRSRPHRSCRPCDLITLPVHSAVGCRARVYTNATSIGLTGPVTLYYPAAPLDLAVRARTTVRAGPGESAERVEEVRAVVTPALAPRVLRSSRPGIPRPVPVAPRTAARGFARSRRNRARRGRSHCRPRDSWVASTERRASGTWSRVIGSRLPSRPGPDRDRKSIASQRSWPAHRAAR